MKSRTKVNYYPAYVYVIFVDGVSRWIGKGKGKRAKYHSDIAKRISRGLESKGSLGFHTKLADAIKGGARVEVGILARRLTDEEAFDLEIKAIAALTRKHLWNICRGGPRTSAAQKKLWQDPKYREARHNGHKDSFTPEWREKVSRRMKASWADPKTRKKHMRAVKKRSANPEFIRKQSVARKNLWADPEFRAKNTPGPERLAKLHEGLKASWATEERRTRASEATKAQMAALTPEQRRNNARKGGLAPKGERSEAHRKNLSRSTGAHMAALSPEAKKARAAKTRIGQRNWWTAERRAAQAERARAQASERRKAAARLH